MHPAKVDYQQHAFAEQFNPTDHQDVVSSIRQNCAAECYRQLQPFLKIDVEYYLQNIHFSVQQYLKTTPYSDDPVMTHKLYVSCLMTLLNQITLSNHNKSRLKKRL